MTPGEIQQRVASAFRQFATGDLINAEQALRDLLREAPNEPNALSLLGEVKRRQGDAITALNMFDRALQLRTDHAATHQGKALALVMLEREAEALASFDTALALKPNDVALHYNRARCLQSVGRLTDALDAYDHAAALAPGDADILNNRAIAAHWLGRSGEAMRDFDAASRLRPDHGLTLYSKGVALLALGDFAQGWPLHEQRKRPGVLANMRDESHGEPKWRGEKLNGALRTWPEQGIGDEILFSRLAPLALERTQNAILQCADRLVPLFKRSFPTLDIRSIAGAAPPPEAQIAAGSLGFALDATAKDLSHGAPYLMADNGKRDRLRVRYETLAQGRPIVGIAWISKNPLLGTHKSTSLLDWGAVLKRDCFFVNLQYGDVSAEIADAERGFGCTIYNDPNVDQMTDLDQFAAQVAAMDRVVSVSNTTVHMAGALGVPCTMLAPPGQGLLWYWGVAGETTPWYASVRVLRRAQGQSWADQVAAAAATL